MSALLSNADCGPVNALSQLQKHSDVDRSLQLDRTAGPSTSRINRLPLTLPAAGSPSAQGAAARFFAEPSLGLSSLIEGSARHVPGRPQIPEWTREFSQSGVTANVKEDARLRGEMEAAFGRTQKQFQAAFIPNLSLQSSTWAAEFHPSSSPYGAMASTIPSQGRITEIPQSMWDQEFARAAIPSQAFDMKGKGRAIGEDIEAAALEQAFARVSVQAGEPVATTSAERDLTAEFESVWTQIRQESAKTQPQDPLASWEADFHAARLEEMGDDPEWDLSEMEQRYQQLTAAARDMDDPGMTMRYDDDGMPNLGDYEFETENPYLSILSPTSLPSLLQQSLASSEPSSLTRSALILEAMIQLGNAGQASQPPQFQLWYTLGQVLVRDERDDKGIRALVRAAKESDGQPDGNAAVLELAIAYVNQSYDMACFLTLLRFLRSAHPSNPSLPDPLALRGQTLWAVRDAVKDAFLSLAQDQHAKNIIDPDIQMGLGVLLYSEAEYDKAAECFQAALSINPENAVLWNRLGSCLSNGNRPEEAIGPYQRALEIWPNYTRAVVNIGVACLNMGAYKEAVEHFLSAIAMHDGSGSRAPLRAIPRGVKSNEDIWKTLRRAFLAMERPELAERALASDRSAEAFRGEGFEF